MNNRKLVQHLSSVENVHRTNSFAIDMSTIYGRDNLPNRLEMFKFVHKQLGLKAEEICDIQDHPFLPQVFVKVKSEAILVRIEQKMKAGVKVFGKDLVLYGWRCDIPLTTVRINGANPDTPRDRIMSVMSKYGEVSACDRGKIDYFKDHQVSDGTWILRIRPEQGKGLPSILYYTEGGNTDIWSYIFDGRVSCCWKCGEQGHRGDQCRSTRPKQAQQGQTAPVGMGTYCDVVKEGLQEEWKGMTNLNNQKSKQKPLLVAKKVQKKPQWPASLNSEWKSVSRTAGNWSELPRASTLTSMVGHRVPDVALQLDNNRYSLLSHIMENEKQSGEMEPTKPGYIPCSTSKAAISKFRIKRKKEIKTGREVNRRLNSNSTARDFKRKTAENVSCGSESEEDDYMGDLNAMDLDIADKFEGGVTMGEGLDKFVEKMGGALLKHMQSGGEAVTGGSGGGKGSVELGIEGVADSVGVDGGKGSHSKELVRHVRGVPVQTTGDSSMTKIQPRVTPADSLSKTSHPLHSVDSAEQQQISPLVKQH